jgi:hypothetical protein
MLSCFGLSAIVRVVLDHNNVFCLQAFLALGDIELYPLTFFQVAVAITYDSVEVDEYIFAFCAFNKTVAFTTIEYCLVKHGFQIKKISICIRTFVNQAL